MEWAKGLMLRSVAATKQTLQNNWGVLAMLAAAGMMEQTTDMTMVCGWLFFGVLLACWLYWFIKGEV